jgi:hypothetical protein
MPPAGGDLAEIQLIMRTFDNLHSTWRRITETVRENDRQLERDKELLAYWEDLRNHSAI